MGEVLITRKSQRGGVPPDGFTQPTQILTESGTWTCPRSGTYRVTCIGSGGKNFIGPFNYSAYFGAVGGGGGGTSVSELKLYKGDAIAITVNSAASSFGNYLSSTAGGDYEISNNSLLAGAVGNGSGGNIANFSGNMGTEVTYTEGAAIDNLIYKPLTKLAEGGTINTETIFGKNITPAILSATFYGNYDYGKCYVCYGQSANSNGSMKPYGSGIGYGLFSNDTDEISEWVYELNGAVIIEYIK